MLTDDENIVMVQFAVQYLLKEPMNYIFKNRHPDDAVTGHCKTAIREIVGKSKMDFVLYEGREQIAANTQKLIQEILDRYETGVLVRSVTMQAPNRRNRCRLLSTMPSKRARIASGKRTRSQAYANDVIPRARGAAARLLEESNGYKQRVIANAEGEASRFKQVLAEYNKAPEVMRSRLYLETVQQVMSSTSKIMIDAKGGNNLLYLPLDKLMQAAGAPIATAAAEIATVSHPAQNVANEIVPPQLEKQDGNVTRARDALRSRERGER